MGGGDRQWRPGGSSGVPGTQPGAGIAPGKQTLVQSLPVQTKLAVGPVGDTHEQEADRVADQVMHRGSGAKPVGGQIGAVGSIAQREPAATPAAAAAPEATSEASNAAPRPVAQLGPQDQLVAMAKERPGQTPQDRDGLAERVASTKGSGEPLPPEERAFFESRFGHDFSDVRIHNDGEAAELTNQLGARAFAHGRDVYFAAGQYQPGSEEGRRLLAHELTHVVQQSRGGGTGVQRKPDDKKPGDNKAEEKTSSGGYAIRVPISKAGDPAGLLVAAIAQAFGVTPERARQVIQKEGWHWSDGAWTGPTDANAKAGYIDVTFRIEAYRNTMDKLKPTDDEREPGGRLKGASQREAAMKQLPPGEQSAINQEANKQFWARTGYKPGKPLGDSPEDQKQAGLWHEVRDELLANRDKLKALPPDVRSIMGGDAIAPKDYEKAVRVGGKLKQIDPKDRAMYKVHGLTDSLDDLERKLDDQKPGASTESPAELQRLMKLFKERVKDPQFSDAKGQSWLKFAKFLDQNKDKIEGILQGSPPGHLTQAKIEQLIGEYGKFISAEPAGNEEPSSLETQEDFDKKFKYDPGWQKLSKEDRRMLIDFAKLNPDEVSDGKVDFTRVTADMKLSMALKLSVGSWPGEVAGAAKAAFTDPGFLITLVLILAIYVGLWLTPEPSGVTKVAAGALTVVLLAQSAWSDIYGFAKAWMELQDECAQASSVTQLQAAGDKFAKKVGQVGFDILMFIAMWGLGKAAKPRLAKIGAERASARAATDVANAEAQPGSGVPQRATPEGAKVLEAADARAKSASEGAAPTDAAVLDALGELLGERGQPEAAKGLKDFRAKVGDANAKKAVASELAKGNDVGKFLTEKGMTPEAKAEVQVKVDGARVRLARAKLVELKINEDPHLRARVATDLQQLAKQLSAKHIGAADAIGVDKAVKAFDVTELVGEIGEALARENLRAGTTGNQTVLSNIEIVREVPGCKTIAEWKAAEIKAGRKGDIGGLYEHNGKLWKSITEVDNMVVEKGAGGKLRIVDLEQTKAGGTHAAAKAQNTKAMAGLNDIASGKTDVQVFERVGKNKLGAQRTADFDLSKLGETGQHTRGLPGSGFDRKLPFEKTTLEDLARQILTEGLPEVWQPPPVVPPTGEH